MSCRRVNGLLSAYLDRELTGAEMLAVQDHLCVCGSCRDEYESLRETKRLVGSLACRASRAELDALLLPNCGREAAPPAPAPLVRPKPIAAAVVLTIAGVWLASSALDGANGPVGSPVVVANGDVVSLEQPATVLVAPTAPAAPPLPVTVVSALPPAGWSPNVVPVTMSTVCVGPAAFCGAVGATPSTGAVSAAMWGGGTGFGSGATMLIRAAAHHFGGGTGGVTVTSVSFAH